MKRKLKYKLRFFKLEVHPDSYEREVTEDEIFIFFSMCTRYQVSQVGKNKFTLTMIFNDLTFIQILEAGYPLYTRLVGPKNFERAYMRSVRGKK